MRNRVDAGVEHRRQRLAAIVVHAPEVLGRELDRRQRVLDVVRDLPRHLGPRLEAVRALDLAALALQLAGHAVERFDEALQLVGGPHDDAGAEVAGGDASGRAREPLHRVADPLGHPVAEAGAEQDEHQRAEQHGAIEVGDLALDLALP